MPRRAVIETLGAGTRFRFPEEPAWQGYPYAILPIPAKYRGDGFFALGEKPVVVQRRDGRYPRYGTIEGFMPVRNDEGKLIYYVVHPSTEVVVAIPAWQWLGTLGAILGGMGGLYWLMTATR